MAAKAQTRNATDATAEPLKAVERVRALISLANGGTTEEEARTSALQAAQLIKEHGLAVVPQAAVEEVKRMVEGANNLIRQAKDEKNKTLIMGLAAGALLGKKFL